MTLPDSIAESLASNSPSARMRAVSWMKENANSADVSEIARALQRESVPQIRRLLDDVLVSRAGSRVSEEPGPKGVGEQNSSRAIGNSDTARLIRHELSPPIGWLQRAGAREITDFARSSTADALNRLDRRIDALVTYVRGESALEMAQCSLESLLRRSWPDPTISPSYRNPLASGSHDLILTDAGFAEMLLANAFQNAIDATLSVSDGDGIEISWDCTENDFWLRITNPFDGQRFDLDEVAAPGTSTKLGHQGVGTSVMQTVARRLGYRYKITGRGGSATFVLRGSRGTIG